MNNRNADFRQIHEEAFKVFIPDTDVLLPSTIACTKFFAWLAKHEKLKHPELNVLNFSNCPQNSIALVPNSIFAIEKCNYIKSIIHSCSEETLTKELLKMNKNSPNARFYFVGALSNSDLRRIAVSQHPVNGPLKNQIRNLPEGEWQLVHIGVKVVTSVKPNGTVYAEPAEVTKNVELEIKKKIDEKVTEYGGVILNTKSSPYNCFR